MLCAVILPMGALHAQAGAAAEQAKAAKVSKTTSLTITGMRWATACGGKVRSALEAIAGVTKTDVKKGSAVVTTDGSVSNEQLVAAIKGAGFGASVDVAKAEKDDKTVGRELNLVVTGMKWPNGCGNKVRSALAGIEGVTVKEVKKGSAKILVKGSATNVAIIKAVTAAGFGATVAGG